MFGFTLAEVLIVLGVIGIIASITIPALFQNYSDNKIATKLKKNFSTLTQCFTKAIQDNGSTVDQWGLTGWDSQSANIIINTISPYLQVVKNCGTGTGCWPSSSWQDSDTGLGKLILSDGTLFAIGAYSPCYSSSNVSSPSPYIKDACAEIYLDVNGFEGNSQLGVDEFYLYLPSNGYIAPAGVKGETWYAFETDCKNFATQSGLGCTAWVLYNQNEDYRKCSNLGWNGPGKCP